MGFKFITTSFLSPCNMEHTFIKVQNAHFNTYLDMRNYISTNAVFMMSDNNLIKLITFYHCTFVQ